MKLSIIIPVLNSHEVVRRQLLHFGRIGLPDDVELILVDDGSDPPLRLPTTYFHAKMLWTNDTRPWTQPKARNAGAKRASGEFLLFTDIDHIIPFQTIRVARSCRYDFCKFKRYLGVLTEDGMLTQDRAVLAEYGVQRSKLRVSCHTLSVLMAAKLFEKVGGFREKLTRYPTHDDGDMKRKLARLWKCGEIKKCPDDNRPNIYVFPTGRFCGDGSDRNANPFGLFHGATRDHPE